MDNQHLASWRVLGCTQRQALELISGPSPTAKTSLMSFNRTQSRVVTGLLTGPNTLRRCLHLMGLTNSPLCRRCGEKDESSADVLYEFKALASLRHVYLGLFFLDSEDIKTV
jgi:hypothetical protein